MKASHAHGLQSAFKQWVKSPINTGGGYNSDVTFPVAFTTFSIATCSAYGVSKQDADSMEQMVIVGCNLTGCDIINWYDGTQGHYIIAIGK